MAAIIVMIVGMILTSSIMLAVAPVTEQIAIIDSQLKARDVSDYVMAVSRVYEEQQGLDATDISRLINGTKEGYETLRFPLLTKHWFVGRNSQSVSYHAVIGDVSATRSGFSYQRIGVVAPPTINSAFVNNMTNADQNACSDQTFYAANEWCPGGVSIWAKIETIDRFNSFLAGESKRIKSTVSKFYRRYSAEGRFTTLSAGSVVTLADSVGYTGAAENCSGVYVFDNEIPLTCNDMFNRWGGDISLQVNGAGSIFIINETNIVRNGVKVVLAEEATLE